MAVDDRGKRMLRQMGTRLTAVRIAAGFEDAAQAAPALGVEAPRYRKYERGQSVPPVPLLLAICTSFETTTDFLLLGRITRARAAEAEAVAAEKIEVIATDVV